MKSISCCYLALLLLLPRLDHISAGLFSAMQVRDYPFVYSHNAATGYINPPSSYASNQVVSLKDQLDCGARMFDIRPEVVQVGDADKLFFHHGSVRVETEFSKVLTEVQTWLSDFTRKNDLVVFIVKDCKGSGQDATCHETTIQALKDGGVTDAQIITNCNLLSDLTVGEALEQGRMGNVNGGGLLVAIGTDSNQGCMDANYDPSIECYVDDKSCTVEQHQDDFEDTLLAHLRSVGGVASNPHSDRFNSLNGHWQYSTESITAGAIAGSSIVNDEKEFGTNTRVTRWVYAGEFNSINALQLDNVCNGGENVKVALESFANITGLTVIVDPTSEPNGKASGLLVSRSVAVASILVLMILGL